MTSDQKPSIQPTVDGPYRVSRLTSFSNQKGALETRETMALCRCGGSEKKPFCDGTHAKNGFSSARADGRVPDRRDDYTEGRITIHDNRGICAHAGECTDRLAAVFRLRQEPWIEPAGAAADEIIATVQRCPSGALSYSRDGVEHRDRDRAPAIVVSPNGPYRVTGGVELMDTPRGAGASTEHYTLCRCGASKNKPFCDGSHWAIDFTDEHN